jgi:hypothetical protein
MRQRDASILTIDEKKNLKKSRQFREQVSSSLLSTCCFQFFLIDQLEIKLYGFQMSEMSKSELGIVIGQNSSAFVIPLADVLMS